MSKSATSETDLLEPVRTMPELEGWQWYPEVEHSKGNPIADAVVIKGQCVGVIEAKGSMSARLLRQGYWWRDKCDWTSLALPAPVGDKRRVERDKYLDVLIGLGLGLIEVGPDDAGNVVATPKLSPARRAPGRSNHLLAVCRAEGRQEVRAQAGTKDGARFSPYQLTVQRMREVLRNEPRDEGWALKEILTVVEHHYDTKSKAIANLSRYAEDSGLRGIRTERRQGLLRLWWKPCEALDESLVSGKP